MKTTIKIFAVIALITSIVKLETSNVLAQQLPYFSQYMLNEYYINPAVAGTKESNIVSMGIRMQWLGFKNAPNTQVASFHGPFFKTMGLGAILFNDRTMPYNQTGLQLSYAYRMDVNNDSKISLGLSGMFYQHRLDKNRISLDEENDLALYGEKGNSFAPDADFGVYYYAKNYHAGLSMPQLLQTRIRFQDADQEKKNKLVRHIYMNGAYKFIVNEEFEVEPSLLLKAIFSAPVQYDLNAKLFYRKMVWGGLSYRNKESVIIMLGVTKDNFEAGYSYDITLTQIRKYSSGSHEIYFGMKIPEFKTAKASIN